jgi:hypothetical protein
VSDESSGELLSVLEAQVELSVSLIDQGRVPEARQVLLEAIAHASAMPVPDESEKPVDRADPAGPGAEFVGSLTEAELEGAFESAEAERAEMIDANQVAQAVLTRADPIPDPPIGVVPDSVFATETVAGLLEQQGDVLGASEVREAIRTRDPVGKKAPGAARAGARKARLATLESWLDNLRKERA